MDQRYERTVAASEPVEAVMERFQKASAEVARRRVAFEDWFAEAGLSEACPIHPEEILVADLEASWAVSARAGANQVVQEKCHLCVLAEAVAARSEWLVRRGVPEVLKHASLENFVPETGNEVLNLATCRAWSKTPTGFLLMNGNIGGGKSHLLAAIIRQVGMGRYRTHERIVQELRGGYGSEAAHYASKEQFEKTKSCALLCWDEFGLGASGADVPEMIHSILCHRFEHRLPTALAFNGPLGPFKALIGDRMESRVREAMFGEPLLFDGRDRRAERNGSYHKQS